MVKNIAGGFQKGESVYVIDSEMALYAEDIGKDGVFIPDKMASEITISGEKETIHTVGCVKNQSQGLCCFLRKIIMRKSRIIGN